MEVPARLRSNYYVGADPALWHINVPHFERVRYRNVYPGIDQVFHADGGRLEFDLVVQPGADASQVNIKLANAAEATVDSSGNLAMGTPDNPVALRRPLTYQVSESGRNVVTSSYRIKSDGTVAIDIGAYDASKPLIIDPVIEYSTFIGGSNLTSMSVDAAGAAYLAGTAYEGAFSSPELTEQLPGSYAHQDYTSGANAFVMKVAADGHEVEYIAVFGSSFTDRSAGLAVTGKGEAILAAVTTGTDYPMVNPLRNTLHSIEAPATYNVITKLSQDGSSIQYSYYHSKRRDAAFESGRRDPLLAIAPDGRLIVATVGELVDAQLPRAPPTESGYRCGSVVVTRIALAEDHEDANFCLAATTVNGLAVDTAGFAHLAGSAKSLYFGNSPISTAISNTTPFDTGVWVSKLNLTTSDVVYHATLAGGVAERDEARGVATDAAGNTYITGFTTSPLYPLVNGRESGLTTRRLPKDLLNRRAAYVTKINSTGSEVLYSTLLNIAGNPDLPPFIDGIFVDDSGHAFVGGSLAAPYTGSGGTTDIHLANAFVAKLSDSGDSVLYSYRLGGRFEEFDTVLAPGRSREMYVAGTSMSPDFPLRDSMLGWNGGVLTTGAFGTSIQTGTTFLARILEESTLPRLSIAAAADHGPVCKPVWISAQVPQATGELLWHVDGLLVATQPLSGGQRQIAFSPGGLRRGTHAVRATYRPADQSVDPATTQVMQTIDAPENCP